MELVKCPRCGEEYSSSYRCCPFCEEDERPRKVRNKMRSGRRVTEKKKTYSGRSALIIILLLVLALLTWVLFGEELVARFAKPDEQKPPVEEVTPPAELNDDPFYDPSIGDSADTAADAVDGYAEDPTVADPPSVDTSTDVSNIKLNRVDITLSLGESFQLKVEGTDASVAWSVENSDYVSIDASGVVKGLKLSREGVDAYATVGGKTLVCRVRVK